MTIGFIGLGIMGQPMALNLTRAGHALVVWNRTPEKCDVLRSAGATVASSPAAVFDQSSIVIMMLVSEAAIDHVLARGTPSFAAMVGERTIVNMSSVPPAYSRALERDVRRAGGRVVEAPVSGSRVPAEQGQLVAMLAGDAAVVAEVRPLLAPLCKDMVFCGPAGNGLLMKLSVNVFMLVTAVGLAESVHFADRHGLPREQLQQVLNAGPMTSHFQRIKIAKLVADDFSLQAAALDAYNGTGLIAGAAEASGISAGLIGLCRTLYRETIDLGHGSDDMIAVIRAIEARSDARARGRDHHKA